MGNLRELLLPVVKTTELLNGMKYMEIDPDDVEFDVVTESSLFDKIQEEFRKQQRITLSGVINELYEQCYKRPDVVVIRDKLEVKLERLIERFNLQQLHLDVDEFLENATNLIHDNWW